MGAGAAPAWRGPGTFLGEAAPVGGRAGEGESPDSGCERAGGGGPGQASPPPRGCGGYKSPTQGSQLCCTSVDARCSRRPAQVSGARPCRPLWPPGRRASGAGRSGKGERRPGREAWAAGTASGGRPGEGAGGAVHTGWSAAH